MRKELFLSGLWAGIAIWRFVAAFDYIELDDMPQAVGHFALACCFVVMSFAAYASVRWPHS